MPPVSKAVAKICPISASLRTIDALLEVCMTDGGRLLRLAREDSSFGISIIIASSQTAIVRYGYRTGIGGKIALYCNGSTEYASIFDYASLEPGEISGRCVSEIDKRMLECQAYLAFDGGEGNRPRRADAEVYCGN